MNEPESKICIDCAYHRERTTWWGRVEHVCVHPEQNFLSFMVTGDSPKAMLCEDARSDAYECGLLGRRFKSKEPDHRPSHRDVGGE